MEVSGGCGRRGMEECRGIWRLIVGSGGQSWDVETWRYMYSCGGVEVCGGSDGGIVRAVFQGSSHQFKL